MTKATQTKGTDLVITRSFDAPRERVWQAWSDPKQVKRWWGPKIFRAPVCQIDFRIGGKYLFCMQSDEGEEAWKKGIWSTGTYKEIVPLEKIVCTDSFADEKGHIVPSSHYGMEGMPEELGIELVFEEIAGEKTQMTLRHKGFPVEMIEMCKAGWNESFDKLADSLK